MTLLPHQAAAACQLFETLNRYGLAYLVGEPRSGKTLSALHCAHLMQCGAVLFATKKKAIAGVEKQAAAMQYPYNLTVTNYEQLDKLEGSFDLVIVDEAHSVGAYPKPSGRFNDLRAIINRNPRTIVLMLSGTPCPESYSQLFHQYRLSRFGPFDNYRNFYDWFKIYGIPSKKYVFNREIACYKKTHFERILQEVEPFITRITQQDAGIRTEVIENFCTIPTPEVIAKSIALIKKNKVINTRSGDVVLADTAAKELSKVHQLSSGTVKTESGEMIVVSDFKARYIAANFPPGSAIFYLFKAELTALKLVLGEQLTESPEEFKQGGKYLALQIQSGREGVDLSHAKGLIFYNVHHAAVSYWQARERMQNVNRSEPSQVFWLFSSGGIERAIYETVADKKDFTTSTYKVWAKENQPIR